MKKRGKGQRKKNNKGGKKNLCYKIFIYKVVEVDKLGFFLVLFLFFLFWFLLLFGEESLGGRNNMGERR